MTGWVWKWCGLRRMWLGLGGRSLATLVALVARRRDAVAATARPGAQATACARACALCLGGFRCRETLTVTTSAAYLLGRADGAVVANVPTPGTVGDSTFLAAAGGVGGYYATRECQ